METVSQSTEHDREIKDVSKSALNSVQTTTPQLPSTTVTLPGLDAAHLSLKTVPVNNTQQSSSIKHIFSSLRNTFDIHFNPNVFCAGVLLTFWTGSVFTLQLFGCKHEQTILEICAWLYIYTLLIYCSFIRCTFPQGKCRRYPETETAVKGCCNFPHFQSNPCICKLLFIRIAQIKQIVNEVFLVKPQAE